MSKPLNNFVFFGGRIFGYRCLKVLLELNLRPAIVVVNTDEKRKPPDKSTSILKLALDEGLSIMDFKQLVSKNGLKTLKVLSPSVGFCAFFPRIIPTSVFHLFKLGITNIHFSLLPEHRGQFPTVYAIFEGQNKTGVTLHWINEEVDLGDIILQETIKITYADTGKSLFTKCLEKGVDCFERQISFYKHNSWPESQIQNKLKASKSPVRIHLPNEGKINWSWSGERIRNFIRAMTFPPYDIAEFSIGNNCYEIRSKNNQGNKPN